MNLSMYAGEMIVGPTKTLFMDEISSGLDSSTTYQIVKCMQQIAHLTEATVLMSLLQPSPETFDLFDDIILLSEGRTVYSGPRDNILEFFESCGFLCPDRKETANFLQEVTARTYQEQYWSDRTKPYRYIPVAELEENFRRFHVGAQLQGEISKPFDVSQGHKAALVVSKYSVSKMELLSACMDREWLLMKRNSFMYITKTVQLIVSAVFSSTVFIRTSMHTSTEQDGALYVGALLYALVTNMLNGFSEVSLMILRLPVLYKQRDLLFYPAWAFTVSNFFVGIPISIMESVFWVGITYFSNGLAPEFSRFLKLLLLIFLILQTAAGLFRLIAGVCRTMIVANSGGVLGLLLVFVLGGFILPKGRIPKLWGWGYWVSPMTYGYNAITVNEFFALRWTNRNASNNSTRLGIQILENIDVFADPNWFWIGAAALLAFTFFFNLMFTLVFMYLSPPGKLHAMVCEDEEDARDEPGQCRSNSKKGSFPRSLSSSDGNNTKEMANWRMRSWADKAGMSRNVNPSLETAAGVAPKRQLVLPFTPQAMSFDSVSYFVDMPSNMKEQGVVGDKLQLIREVTGSFRPGVLTALMGVSGAGKTTLMDVLTGRKTSGYIEGDIRISGFPKKHESFARISGYCEQTDIHSPQMTVKESLIFSAFLRLPGSVRKEEKMIFVNEVMELVELENLQDAIVGLPGVMGLSIEQRKRLTIAVELVANPSIIFMDEPTSGLDSRAAAIVMRTVRNTVDTGRTIVCTIHQPSIDIYEVFDELLLMKTGGQVIYAGSLGPKSQNVIQYLQEIPGVPKLKENYNPATWMLEVSSEATEAQLGIDYAEYYKSSPLFLRNKRLVSELSKAPAGAKDVLCFATKYPQPTWYQFESCLWKQWLTYWRSPNYNLTRLLFSLASAFFIGTIFWRAGSRRESSTDVNVILGAMFSGMIFVGFQNCVAVQPVVAIERTVFYRERTARMYSSLPYALAQVVCEVPYVLFQASCNALLVYAMVAFEWTATKFFWFLFITFFTFLNFTYYGMVTVAVTPNYHVAAIVSIVFFGAFSLFSGLFIHSQSIPRWWIWFFRISPLSWTLYGVTVSQYGDELSTIVAPGFSPDPTIKWYVENYLGYDTNFMPRVAVVLVCFPLLLALLFACFIKTLNFQRR